MKRLNMRIQLFCIAAAINMSSIINYDLYKRIATPDNPISAGTSLPEITLINYYLVAISFVCALGCIGTLLTNVSRRRVELAMHIVSGATPINIYKIVVIDWTLKIAALQTILGFLFSSALVWMLSSQSLLNISFYSPVVPLLSLLAMLIFCTLIAIYPASRASRLSVTQILSAM